jgi:hypothetical protein
LTLHALRFFRCCSASRDQIGLNELVRVAVHYGIYVSGFNAGAVVLLPLVGTHIGV